MTTHHRRIAILGAGPVGLEAAHALAEAGHDVHVYEQGAVGAAILRWGHVALFSPWALNTSARGLAALADMDAPAPDPREYPTGAQFVARYLEPLAKHKRLKKRVHTHTKVIQVARDGVLKGELIASPTRREHPFRLLLERADGREEVAFAEVVIDTTGHYDQPNHLGDGGIPALGERRAQAQGRIHRHIPDANGADAEAFAGKHTLVVGSGYSAITSLNHLLKLQARAEGTRLSWATRTADEPYHRVEGDPLPERDWLALLGNALAAGERGDVVDYRPGVTVTQIAFEDGGPMTVTLRDASGQERQIEGVDTIVSNVGYRPDPSLHRELQVHQCYASEGPMKLAAAMLSASGGGGDCLTQEGFGPETLKSPEPDFFILGSKSYGRGSTFLMKLGLDQIEDVLTLLQG